VSQNRDDGLGETYRRKREVFNFILGQLPARPKFIRCQSVGIHQQYVPPRLRKIVSARVLIGLKLDAKFRGNAHGRILQRSSQDATLDC
jgi:hypothetical protein